MCYTDIFLVKKCLCVKLGFVCVTTIDQKFTSWTQLIELINYKKISGTRQKHLDIISKKMNRHWNYNENKWTQFFNLTLNL